jgi:hypothetical protein
MIFSLLRMASVRILFHMPYIHLEMSFPRLYSNIDSSCNLFYPCSPHTLSITTSPFPLFFPAKLFHPNHTLSYFSSFVIPFIHALFTPFIMNFIFFLSNNFGVLPVSFRWYLFNKRSSIFVVRI